MSTIQPQPPIYGHRAGLRQTAFLGTLQLAAPGELDFERLDSCLNTSFGVQREQAPATPERQADTRVFEFAWRVLLVARTLMQAARIPSFEPGRVLGIAAGGNESAYFRVTFAAPAINYFPERGLGIAYTAAHQVVHWTMANLDNPSGLDRLYAHLQNKVLPALRAMAPSGVSTLPILECAFAQNIPFSHIGAGVYQLGWGARSQLIDRSSVTTDSAIGSRLSQNKLWTAQRIRAAGLPAPEHHLVGHLKDAERSARQIGWPLVVKPADRDRSEGVTIGIDSMEKLHEAFGLASTLSRNILVERQVPGICYRLLVANGKLLYALSRRPKALTGDGRRNITELLADLEVTTMAKPPWLRGKIIAMDALTRAAIGTLGLAPESVPEAGSRVPLRSIESSEWGGDISDVTLDLHPDNAAIALQAAQIFHLKNAGIDIISPDIRVPWHENGAVLNEVNYAPYFGGNPIARAKLPEFVNGLLADDGRIPITVYFGAESAWHEAVLALAAQRQAGVNCFLSNHRETLNATQVPIQLAVSGLFRRTLALLTNPEVEALILVVQTDEFLHTGLPVDQVIKLVECLGDLEAVNNNLSQSAGTLKQSIKSLLLTYRK